MAWTTPDFVEIKMDAEISSYQEDRDPTKDPFFSRSDTQIEPKAEPVVEA